VACAVVLELLYRTTSLTCYVGNFFLCLGNSGICGRLLYTVCDPLWENRPNRQLVHNEIEARKVDALITAVGDPIFFFFIKSLNPHYLLNILVIFYEAHTLLMC